MRTTISINDELLLRLKEKAAQEKISLTKLLNRILKEGMQSSQKVSRPKRSYREKSFPMGEPLVGLDKALALAGKLEGEEIVRKILLRK